MTISYNRKWKKVDHNNNEVGDFLTALADFKLPAIFNGERKTGGNYFEPSFESDSIYCTDIAGESSDVCLITPAFPGKLLGAFSALANTDCVADVTLKVRIGIGKDANGDVDTSKAYIDITPETYASDLSKWYPICPVKSHPAATISASVPTALLHGLMDMGGRLKMVPYFQVIGLLGGTEAEKQISCQVFCDYL